MLILLVLNMLELEPWKRIILGLTIDWSGQIKWKWFSFNLDQDNDQHVVFYKMDTTQHYVIF